MDKIDSNGHQAAGHGILSSPAGTAPESKIAASHAPQIGRPAAIHQGSIPLSPM
jgi:hypothetical protein